MDYSEKHHILPRSTFPEYENEEWNIIELDYEDHKLSHLWIFKAINIRKYQRPLNWMMNYYKNSEETSNAAKKGWVKLKKDKEKYNNWRKGKSDMMKEFRNSEKYKEYMINYSNNNKYFDNRYSSEIQRKRINIFWENISDDDYEKFCKKMKSCWTEEKRLEKSNQMNEYYSNPDNVEKKRKETKDRWDNLDDDYRRNF